MAASLQLLDNAGTEIDLSDANPVAFGTVNAGTTGGPIEIKVKNTGDEDVFFVTVRSAQHPSAQVGAEDDTFAATAFSETQDGNFVDELELGTLAPGDEVSVWVRWVVPTSAPAGAVVWAVEAIGSET